MLRTKKGFTLIELLVVIVIIGILVAIALPNFIKIKIKAREAEIKSNLHAIQLAIERYATDSGGQYPFFIYGGDVYYNVGTMKYVRDWVDVMGPGVHPFDMFNLSLTSDGPIEPHTYPNVGLNRNNMGDAGYEFGDTLAYEGYMPEYPQNPFLSEKATIMYGEESVHSDMWTIWTPWRGCGGTTGRNMFNIGWSGEGPVMMAYDIDGEGNETIKMEFPGQFYYHPRFSDGACNADHFAAMHMQVYGTTSCYVTTYLGSDARAGQVWSHDVAGYDLLAFGDPSTDGMDIDYPIATNYKDYAARTGYLNNVPEPNPHNAEDDYKPRTIPDGIPDYYIIHLSSSQDAKPQGII